MRKRQARKTFPAAAGANGKKNLAPAAPDYMKQTNPVYFFQLYRSKGD
jgi:hypothetical protein